MLVPFTVVVPARFASQRLPGKALLDIAGKPMVQHVYEQATKSRAKQVIVATDDERIAEVVNSFGGVYCMTSKQHRSGTDRLQEVVEKKGLSVDALIVNVQGDEPQIPPAVINQVASNLVTCHAAMATLYEQIDNLEDMLDPNIVKVVTDDQEMALYFSRAPIPYDRDRFPTEFDRQNIQYKRHLGIYAYRVAFLNEFVSWVPDVVEQIEKLEQLRILRHGLKIHVAKACETIPPGIDTEKDLLRTRAIFEQSSATSKERRDL